MGLLGRYRPKAPNTQTPFFGSMLEELSIDNLRSSSEIFSALFHLPARYSGFEGNLSCIFPSSLPDIRSSPEIFPAFFHLPWPTFRVRRESSQRYSIYPGRSSEFVGNLSSNFPSTLPDIRSSPGIFPPIFHLP